ncbi:MmgE/PrpD family protein [Stygiolobus caldivivus]|uniref:2-methylcitrate dehydratase n=1 Tax=Stygiolobus caldivivus TaxID=2824673 RepID=A0A8D5ZIV6_9CREN|nr:MmgE/PrpD family protein [Stygiolobus caldivivus]BCU70934.1 2-methylcitrate dehydratase [Stygiolobus caldivivus]
MDLSDILAEYVTSVQDINDRAYKEAKRRVLDSIAVAMASKNSPPAKIVEGLSSVFQGGAPTLGFFNATPDFASFYNTLLIRYLDFNDTYLGLEPLHPSDMIGGLLSVSTEVKGSDIIRAIVVGYDVGVNLCDTTSLRKKGFDHVNFLEVATASALSNLLSLDRAKAKNAISLSIIPHVALRETRSGKLSMWKAGAAAEAVRNAVFATLLARAGLTGPELPFSGIFGFSTVIAKDMDVEKIKLDGNGILRTFIKKYPVEYHAQAAVETSLSLDYRGEIRKVLVETYEAGKTILADSRDKWRPQNKETADHSLPFIVSVSLLRKDFWLDSYSLIGNSEVESLMDKVEVVEREDYTKVYPNELPTKVTVITDQGEFSKEVRVPRGHYNNPMSDEELEEKAMRLGLTKRQISIINNFDDMKVGEFVRSLKEV